MIRRSPLAVALARPSIKFSGALGSQKAPVAAALVFDTSMRMEYVNENPDATVCMETEYPNRPDATPGPALTGIDNVRPETKKIYTWPVDPKKLPFDPLEYIEHLDQIPFDPDMDPDLGQ